MRINIIETITKSVGEFFKGIGGSFVDMFKTLFVGAEGELTTFAIVSLTFLGLSIAMGFFTWCLHLVKR